MNTTLTPYMRTRIAQAQFDYLVQLSEHCDYALTMHTNLSTYGIGKQAMAIRVRQTQQCLRQFRQRLNRLLTGNGYVRKNHYVPVFIPAIEGAADTNARNKTLHVHAALGNTGHTATAETRALLLDGIRQIWTATEYGKDDIDLVCIRPGTENKWIKYISKEAERKNIEVIDYENTQIPMHLFKQL